MASLSASAVSETQVNWAITGLSNAWNTSFYLSAILSNSPAVNDSSSPPSGILASMSAPSSGSSTSTGSQTTDGGSAFSAGNSYTLYGTMQAENTRYYNAGSTFVTMPSPPELPDALTGLTATVVSASQINTEWNSSAGATGYRIYRDGSLISDQGSTFCPHTGLSEYTSYSFQVIPYNSSGDGTGQSTNATTSDDTDPSISANDSNIQATSFDISWTASDSHSGLDRVEAWDESFNTIYLNTSPGSSGSFSRTGLTPNSNYTTSVFATDNQGNQATTNVNTLTALAPRPDDFVWTNTKTFGEDINVDATEWNSLATRVNEFRAYQELEAYSISSVSSGTGIDAIYFNEMRSAINEMTPPTSPPSAVTSGITIITADHFNDLVSSLNSIV